MGEKDYGTVDVLKLLVKIAPVEVIVLLFYTLLNALIPAYQTLALGSFIDTATKIFHHKMAYEAIFLPAGLLFLSIIFINLMPPIMNLVDLKFENKLELSLKDYLITKRGNLAYEHIENSTTQDLLNRVYDSAVHHFERTLKSFFGMIGIVFNTVSLLLIIMRYSYLIGILIVLISIPLFYKSMKLGRAVYGMNAAAKKFQRRYDYLAKVLTDREFSYEREIFRFTPRLTEQYGLMYGEAYKLERTALIKTFFNLKLGSIVTLFLALAMIALLLTSIYHHVISIGIFIGLTNAILNLVQTMSWDLSTVMLEFAEVKEYLADFSRFATLSEKPEAVFLPAKIAGFQFRSLEFKAVSFCYPGTEHYVLRNCSFKLQHDLNYGFVGKNGAGKTTIIKLITGMYEDYEGTILLNERNLKDYTFSELKAIISVAFQDFAHYADTIRENIVVGDPLHEEPEKLARVLKKVGLDSFCETLPEGVDTYIGKARSASLDLSGGQWQKVALARLLYADAPINLLDEPTAALDPYEESRIYHLFKKVNANHFTLYITHRLGVVKTLDHILVLADGKVQEEGSHDELMAAAGVYREMYDSQKHWYETKEPEHA